VKKRLQEFKKFAIKGKVVDMAVGVILGGAFSRIVTSFVNDILMPFISIFTGSVSVAELAITIPSIDGYTPPVLINYGQFLQNIIDFFIIAICIFMMVKLVTGLRKKYTKHKHVEEKKSAPPSKEEELLLEIRDMLKKEGEM